LCRGEKDERDKEREKRRREREKKRRRERGSKRGKNNVPNCKLVVGEHTSPGFRVKGEETGPIFLPHFCKGTCQKRTTNLGEFTNIKEIENNY